MSIRASLRLTGGDITYQAPALPQAMAFVEGVDAVFRRGAE
jgi:hypothetical protein